MSAATSQFFSKFPQRYYDVHDNGTYSVIVDIFRNVDADSNGSSGDETAAYTYEYIRDGERPDTLSFRLYGDTSFYWTFFVLNHDMREGLRSGWPMSSHTFEKMMAREYDMYSVMTFLPEYDATLTASTNDFTTINLSPKYLPYLRLGLYPLSSDSGAAAKILRWDSEMLQLWLYDVPSAARFDDPEASFRLQWVNPFTEGSAEWVNCNNLKIEWMLESITTLSKTNPNRYLDFRELAPIAEIDSGGELSPEILTILEEFTLGTPLKPKDFWDTARHAPKFYYSAGAPGESKELISAYDAMTLNARNPNVVRNFEYEEFINHAKARLRVARPNHVAEFAQKYFETLQQ